MVVDDTLPTSKPPLYVHDEASVSTIKLAGIFTSDIDSWKWRLTTLLHSNDKQELISREKKDRRDYEKIAELATSMSLHRRAEVKDFGIVSAKEEATES
ncbi:DEA(D/H)-box RNA helicase family protein [Artemisia annua]|uniref:DEA(D/H)-box RNA helicase family protein n=1 Tax=Artemisia annua TaxID=35608 RepID=A0A2U1PFK1_ARTAN|nr:DEA(D/H)-box RNA helicase family protein [Artemisia annua]